MSVGIAIAKADLDNTAGNLARSWLNINANIKQMKAWLDATPDSNLTSAPYSYTTAEVATLKSAFADLAQLVTIAEGGASLATAKDFRAFAKQLAGILY